MPLFKKQRYEHSEDVYNEVKDKDVWYERYDNGTYYEVDGKHVNVPDGKIGPAVNMALVILFSTAGIIALVLIFLLLESMKVA